MSQIINRMVRAARLEPALYEEVEADRGAMGQAMAVVLISSLAAGVGGAGGEGSPGFLAVMVGALLGWLFWSLLVYLIGAKLLPEEKTQADLGQLMRTIGFSASPGVLRVLGFIPLLGIVIQFVAQIWMLAAMIVAVRQALDYRGTGRALLVCLIGFLVNLLIVGLFFRSALSDLS